MVAGSESASSLNFDGDVVVSDLSGILGAVDEKASAAHRRQPGQSIGAPAALRRAAKFERRRRRFSRRRGDKFAERLFPGRKAEINLDHPALALSRQRLFGLR